jgi:hypothetical protein
MHTALVIGTILMRSLTFVFGQFSFVSWKMLNPEVFIQLRFFFSDQTEYNTASQTPSHYTSLRPR